MKSLNLETPHPAICFFKVMEEEENGISTAAITATGTALTNHDDEGSENKVEKKDKEEDVSPRHHASIWRRIGRRMARFEDSCPGRYLSRSRSRVRNWAGFLLGHAENLGKNVKENLMLTLRVYSWAWAFCYNFTLHMLGFHSVFASASTRPTVVITGRDFVFTFIYTSADSMEPGAGERATAAADMESGGLGEPKAVAALPTLRILNPSLAAEVAPCSLCEQEFELEEELRVMPCRHMFHSVCLLEWLGSNNGCPLCGFALPVQTGDVIS